MKLRTILVVLPASVIGASFAIANRSFVRVSFDPTGLAPFLATPEIPLFLVVLASMFIGILIGGAGAWLGHRKKKRAAAVTAPVVSRPTTRDSRARPKSTLPVAAAPHAQRDTKRPALPAG